MRSRRLLACVALLLRCGKLTSQLGYRTEVDNNRIDFGSVAITIALRMHSGELTRQLSLLELCNFLVRQRIIIVLMLSLTRALFG